MADLYNSKKIKGDEKETFIGENVCHARCFISLHLTYKIWLPYLIDEVTEVMAMVRKIAEVGFEPVL